MSKKNKWFISEEEKARYIDALCDMLPSLRAKAGIPQDDLAKQIGVSRQTFGGIERKIRPMSWNTYLSLIFFFDYNTATHDTLRSSPAFPTDIISRFNNGGSSPDIKLSAFLGISDEGLMEQLDEQALYAIKTVLMVEYARCTNLSGEAVVKSFDGKSFTENLSEKDILIRKTLNKIKGSKK